MAKLHELLAVEGDLGNVYKSVLEETSDVLQKKPHLFTGFVKRLEWFEDGQKDLPEEHDAMDTTVSEKLDYQAGHITRYLDAVLQKERTNQDARADIIIDGETIAKDIPATFLLGLEKYLKQIKIVYLKIPTLPPGIDWERDTDKGSDVYSRKYPEETIKTKTVIVPQILYKATEKHPAQVDKISETVNVGKYVKHVWSGMLRPAEKHKLLERLGKLIQAVKKARQRANSTEVVEMSVGDSLFKYLNKD